MEDGKKDIIVTLTTMSFETIQNCLGLCENMDTQILFLKRLQSEINKTKNDLESFSKENEYQLEISSISGDPVSSNDPIIPKKQKSEKTRIDEINRKIEKNEIDCTICLDDLKSMKCKALICGHCFHENCINPWLKNNKICPICKTSLIIKRKK